MELIFKSCLAITMISGALMITFMMFSMVHLVCDPIFDLLKRIFKK